MREAFVQTAVLDLEDGADTAAPGGAVTVALCGSWEHAPPCPLAPHLKEATAKGGRVSLRIVFAAEPQGEAEVRSRIAAALGVGRVTGPDGRVSRWTMRTCAPDVPTPDEVAHGRKIGKTDGATP